MAMEWKNNSITGFDNTNKSFGRNSCEQKTEEKKAKQCKEYLKRDNAK